MNWSSVKNGKLLQLAIENGFNIFVTTDKNLQYQQNIQKVGISLIVLNVKLLKWSFIELLIPKLITIIPTVESGNVYIIE